MGGEVVSLRHRQRCDRHRDVSQFPHLKIRHPDEEDDEDKATEMSSFRTSFLYPLRLKETRLTTSSQMLFPLSCVVQSICGYKTPPIMPGTTVLLCVMYTAAP